MSTIPLRPNGSATLLRLACYRQAMLMNAIFATCGQAICVAIGRCICSQASAAGLSPAAWLTSRMTSRSGREAAPVNPSRSPAGGAASAMNGTYGRIFSASSVPPGRLSSWESRLRERLGMVGSMEFDLIWKAKRTPAGRSISRLAPSTRPIADQGCSGAVWPTPDCSTGGPDPASRRTGVSLQTAMTAWATPTARDWRSGEASEATHARNARPLNEQMVAAWATPRASDHFQGYETAAAAAVADPSSLGAWKQANRGATLTTEVMAFGATPNGSSATTARRGVPNPVFPCWLMGYPAAWLYHAPGSRANPRFRTRKHATSAVPLRGGGSAMPLFRYLLLRFYGL